MTATKNGFVITDAYVNKIANPRECLALKGVIGCERRIVNGETRYYDSETQYATFDAQFKIHWFKVTPDGDTEQA